MTDRSYQTFSMQVTRQTHEEPWTLDAWGRLESVRNAFGKRSRTLEERSEGVRNLLYVKWLETPE